MHRFVDLQIWTRARQLGREVYQITKTFPNDERFGITSQLRRAAVSVSSNIAEGCGRNSAKDLARFIDMAIGSICECESLVYLSVDLKFLPAEEGNRLLDELDEIKKMSAAFKRSLKI